MQRLLTTCFLTLAALTLSVSAPAQEITIEVNPDSTVHIKQGYQLEQVNTGDTDVATSEDVSRMTVLFPEQNPAVYELESEEDYVLIVDGSLPEGADILLQATVPTTGQVIEDFEHVIRGGDWLIDAKYLGKLPAGEVTISATLRTPGRTDAIASHLFYILEPRQITEDDDGDLFDWELDDLDNIAPYLPGEGFLAFTPPADARVYYVSATGNDNNDGLSESRALRTLAKAYGKIRDKSGDWILLKAGDVFEGGFDSWSKSGKSLEEPLHVGVYGEGDRPIVHSNGKGFWQGYGTVTNIRMDGIHALANLRLGKSSEEMIWKESGFRIYGKGGNYVLHDMKIEGFKFGIVLQGYSEGAIKNAVMIRCIVNNSFGHWDGAVGGHSSGIYADAVDGLRFIECTFDRNGWNPQVNGAKRTKFNHNFYVQYNCANVAMSGSIVTRGSSHGLQLRCGGDVINNLFVRNALGFYVSRAPSLVLDNVVMDCDDIDDREIRGQGININPVVQATVANNIVTVKSGRAGWMPGIQVSWTKALNDLPSFNVEMHDNVIWDWWMDNHHDEIIIDKAARVSRYNNTVDGVVQENGSRVVYNDPTVDFDSYVEGGFSEFLNNAVNRRRGEWNEQFTAPVFNDYMRQGFSTGGGGGDL